MQLNTWHDMLRHLCHSPGNVSWFPFICFFWHTQSSVIGSNRCLLRPVCVQPLCDEELSEELEVQPAAKKAATHEAFDQDSEASHDMEVDVEVHLPLRQAANDQALCANHSVSSVVAELASQPTSPNLSSETQLEHTGEGALQLLIRFPCSGS